LYCVADISELLLVGNKSVCFTKFTKNNSVLSSDALKCRWSNYREEGKEIVFPFLRI
jgi:hypothetical protein